MSSREQKNNRDDIKMILIIVLSIVVIVSAIVAIFINLKNGEGSKPADQNDSNSESVLVNETVDMQGIKTAINELILDYRAAFGSGDIDALANIYNMEEVIDADIIVKTANIIKGYENTTCYIKPGDVNNTYVVFIYDELRIADIEPLIPNLDYVYVMQQEDGSYYIYRGEYDKATGKYYYSNEIQAHIEQLISEEDIKALYTDVNERFAKLREEYEDLENFIQKIYAVSNETDTEETIGETTGNEETSSTESSNQADTVDT